MRQLSCTKCLILLRRHFTRLKLNIPKVYNLATMNGVATKGDIKDIMKQIDHMAAKIVERFDRIEKSLEEKATKDDIRKIMDTLDFISKRQEISDDERLVMGHQLERLDQWTHELAKKIGYKLST